MDRGSVPREDGPGRISLGVTKRADTTYTFGCDYPECKQRTSYGMDSQPPGWAVLLVQFDGDRKERHYCTEHKEAVLVYLGLKKPAPVAEAAS